MKKKLLFLTQSYPNTHGSASILCTHRVMECVANTNEYEVHVLCIKNRGEQEEENVNGICVHRFVPSWFLRLQSRMNGKRRILRLFELVQKTIMIPYFPQIYPVTTHLFINAARKLHEKENFEAVISAHGGLQPLLAGCQMKKENKELKHITLLWDPVMGQIATHYLPKYYTSKRIERVENFLADQTTLQISTASMREYHRDARDIAADHRCYLDIPGILPPEPEVETSALALIRNGSINIVFSGLLSVQQRNPLPIINLLNGCKCVDKMNIIFFSRGANTAMEEAAKSFKGNITCHDYIPLNELHTVYRHADYLLNVSHINANMVPSKIFEYMSYGKPIISTFTTYGDAAEKYVSKYQEGLCIDLKRSNEENVLKLNSFFETNHKPVPFEVVRDTFSNNTPLRYFQEIKKVIEQI